MLSFRISRCVLAVAFAIFLISPQVSAQSNVVDASTLTSKLIMGYQGWHAAQGDGSALNSYIHWSHSASAPSTTDMVDDIWPDLSEFSAGELFAAGAGLNLGNGQPAKVYSAYKSATVNRHFQWMKDYGIDGVLLQRFIKDVMIDANWAALRNTNLVNVRVAAETYGRVFAVEYDMSNDDPALVIAHLSNDWAYVTQTLGVTNSSRYLKHKGKPVVAVYGLGFSGNAVPPTDAQTIINNFKNSGCTVVGGVPYNWHTLNNDSQTDPAWLPVYHSFDVISPWAVGRYQNTNQMDSFKTSVVVPDLADLTAHGQDYMPVILPGYSAANLAGGTKNGIPRIGGRFYWRQAYDTISVGCTMLFGAMFDEVDEGTATYKLAPTMTTSPTNSPVGTNIFALDVDGESLPSDWYLRVAGQINRAVHGDVPLNEALPISPTNQITITSPNGGNTWTQGTQVTVTWSTTGTVSAVNIDLSTDDGDNWSRLISNLPNTGSKTLRVPHIAASSRCRVRVSEIDGTPADFTDTNFTIQSATTNLGTHLEPLWSIAPGSRSYVTVAATSTPNQRSIAYNALSNQVYIISRTGATTGLTINVVNATTGVDLYSLNTGGISVGSIILLMMSVADDGALYAANMTGNAGSTAFKVYRWTNSASATPPVLIFSGEPAQRTDAVRWGDTMHVRGAGMNTQIIIDSQATNLCAILVPTNISLNGWISSGSSLDNVSNPIGRGIQFGNGDTFWQKRKADRLQQSSFTLSPLTTTAVTNYNIFNSTAGSASMDFTQNFLAAINFSATTNQPDTLDFYDATNIYNAALLGSYDFPTNQQGNANFIAHVIFGGDKVFAIDGNNGVITLQVVSPPQITTHPQSQTVSNSTTISFNVAATGASLNYQWKTNGTAIPGATNSTLNLTNVQSADSATYTVFVNNSAGFVTSSNAVLTVLTPISITSQPANTTNNAATTATLSVAVTGSNPQFQWRKNSTNISNGGNISGATTASLTVSSLLKADAGSYSVVITNTLNATTSSVAYLEVIDPLITSQPQDKFVPAGASATFSVTATGTTPLNYRWKKNGTDLSDAGNISGATTTSLTVANVQSSDATNYTVAVSNAVGFAISSAATLTIVQPPTITNQPVSRTNNAGTAATFSVGASGLGLSYQWLRNSTNITDGGNISGATSSTLTVSAVTSPDAVSYSVIVTNAAGSVTSLVATLTIVFPLPYYEPFNYSSGTNLGGQTNGNFLSWFDVGFTNAGAYVSNVAGNLSIAGLPASIGNRAQFGGNAKSARFSFATGTAVTSGTLYYSFIFRALDTNTLNTTGAFMAGFNNSIGSQSNTPTVVAPRLYIRLATGGYNLGVAKNSSISTDWVWDSRVFTTNDVLFVVGSYTFNSANSTDDICKMWINPSISDFGSNNAPAASATATGGADITANQIASFVLLQRSANEPAAMLVDELRIATNWSSVTPNPPPVINTQPASRTNLSGTTATFSVTATGTNVTYQWQRNGATLSNAGNISGATTANLTLANVAPADAGTYLVIVSTPGGSATSSPATLTVTGGGDPIITTQPQSQTVSLGANASFTVAAGGTSPFTYQWRLNGTNLASQTSTKLSLTNVNFPQAGKYSTVVSNSVSFATSSDAILSVTTFQPGSGIVLGGGVGGHYQIDYSTNLNVTNWTTLSNFFLPSSPLVIPDNTPSTSTQRFYRVILLP